MKIALVGLPNSGKTTLYNRLTGQTGDVGNRAGVTVHIHGAAIRGTSDLLFDLPGIYTLTPGTEEERVARSFLDAGYYDRILCVIDATAPERGLELAFQLAQFRKPVILAFSFLDVLQKNGGHIDSARLSEITHCKICPFSGVKKRSIAAIRHALTDPECISTPFEPADPRRFADQLAQRFFETPSTKQRVSFVDRFFAQSWLAVPFFFAVMGFIFWLTFGLPGQALSALFADVLHVVGKVLHIGFRRLSIAPFWVGLLLDGVWNGIQALLTFLPQLSLLFFCLCFLEESGYLARTAFLSDHFFRRFGLSGRSAVPILLGFGCTVPAVLSTRTVPNHQERQRLWCALPFISCGARLPVYGMICAAFFPRHAFFVVFVLYALGVFFALCRAALFHQTRKPDEKVSPTLFFVELPPYRMPRPAVLFRLVSARLSGFIRRTFTVMSGAFALFWILKTFTPALTRCTDGSFGILGRLGQILAPCMRPVGLGIPVLIIALFAGFLAKEAILGTLAVLLGCSGAALSAALQQLMDPAQAAALLVFVLLYTPCVSTLAAIRSESGSLRFMLRAAVCQMLFAYAAAFIAYQATRLFTI